MKKTQLENALKKYIDDDMIMVFDSLQELMDFINFDCPEIEQKVESWEDVKSVLDEYVFYYNGKYYDVMFDEALEVRNYLPRGFFEMPKKLSHTKTYEEFEAFVDGRLEGHNSARFKCYIINEYARIIGENDWVTKATDIKTKMDFKCFKYTEDFSEEEQKNFIEDLRDYLGLESIDIDDPKTWLPRLKQKGYFEDIGFAIQDLEEDFYNALDRLYDGIEEYNEWVYRSQEVIAYYNKYYDDYDETSIAFSVGRVCELDNEIVNHYPYEQKKIFEMVKKCWKEFDGFSFDEEDYK